MCIVGVDSQRPYREARYMQSLTRGLFYADDPASSEILAGREMSPAFLYGKRSVKKPGGLCKLTAVAFPVTITVTREIFH